MVVDLTLPGIANNMCCYYFSSVSFNYPSISLWDALTTLVKELFF